MKKNLLLTALLLTASAPCFTAFAEPDPQAQNQAVTSITGTVLDENDEPVAGATVREKGNPTNATSTNFDGNFSLKVAPGTTLEVIYIGYKTEEVKAANDMTVYLNPTTQYLDEVVAIGYGTQKRVNLTGAVSTVDVARVMDSRSTNDVAKALQGAVPGLTVTNSDGAINSTANLKIRGTGTLSNGAVSNPLIVVDGVVVEDITFLNPDDIAEISVLKDAASASIYGTRAAFGVLLITTKEPNRQDRVSVKYSNNFGWSRATMLPDYPDVYTQIHALTEGNLMSGGEIGLFGMDPFLMMPLAQLWSQQHNGKKAGYREAQLYQGPSNVGDWQILDSGQGLFYADWDKAGIMFNNAAPSNYHNVSLEGTSGKTSYRIALGYNQKQELLNFNPANLRRYNLNASINTEIFSWWKAGARISFSQKDFKGPYNVRGDYQYLWRWGSYFEPLGYTRDEEGNIVDFRNDISYRKQAGEIDSKATQTRMTFFTDFNLFKGFNLHGDFTYQVENTLETRPYMPVYGWDDWSATLQNGPYYFVPISYADARQTNTHTDGWTMNVFGTYDFTVNNDFNFKVMLGATAEQQDYNYLYAKRDELLDLNLPYLGLTTGGSSGTGYSITQTLSHFATAGFFGRVNFDWKGIWLLEFNGRYDGSSRFPANNQWGFFPSGSAGYRFSEEKYFEPLKSWWSNGKLRGSYGSIGNEAIGSNMFISTISGPYKSTWLTGGNALTQYANIPTLVSSTLTWEKVYTTDLGLDLGFMNNSLNVSFDWYNRETKGMLGPGADFPSTLGATAPYGNNGNLRTRGWELSISWNHSFGDADIYATFNLADARTKVMSWRNDTGKLYSWTPTQSNFTEGTYYGDIWGFVTDRYFEQSDINPETGSPYLDQTALQSGSFVYGVGDIMFVDQNGDGKINFGDPNMTDENGELIPTGTLRNHGDLVKIGNTQPRYEYGIRLGGAWKSFDLDMFFQGVGKRDVWAVSAFVMPFARGTDALYANQTDYNKMVIDMETQQLTGEILVNQNNFYPRLFPGADAQGQMSGINAGRYNFYPQTRYLMNAAYLRFKTLTVGYTLPVEITKKALIQKARIYFSAENLFLLYNGMKRYPLDPETGTGTTGTTLSSSSIFTGNGYYGRNTPMQKTFSFGIQVTL